MNIGRPPIFLASQSPRRRALLGDLRLQFSVYTAKIEEPAAPRVAKASPKSIVATIACHKLRSVLPEISALAEQDEAYIIAADTLVFLGKKVLGKPRDAKEAQQMLWQLRGKQHSVATAVVIARRKKGKWLEKTIVVESKVRFAKYSRELVEWYVSTGEPLDKAGAYGAQGAGTVLIEKIQGSYTNIVGLPLAETMALLAKISGRKWQDWCDGN